MKVKVVKEITIDGKVHKKGAGLEITKEVLKEVNVYGNLKVIEEKKVKKDIKK